MKAVLHDGRRWVLAFRSGESFNKEFMVFLEKESITAAMFWAIGAASKLQLGHYNPKTKAYDKKEWDGQFEVHHLNGNVAFSDGKRALHAHGTFSGDDFQAFGGHLIDLQIRPTLELHLIKLEGGLSRRLYEDIGIKGLV